MKKGNQGFASMDDREKQREIARKGGLAVSKKQDMVELGRRGGKKSGETRRKQKEQRDGLSQ